MRIAYITAHTPYGSGETFVLEEMLSLAPLGIQLVIVPRNPPNAVVHADAERLLPQAVKLPLLDGRMVWAFLKALVVYPRTWKVLWEMIRRSRNPRILLKNLAITPKAVFIADVFRKERIAHIHAHWGSTTSTMAWIASELMGIPWSMTLHRWDIAENNLLGLKVERAAFVRTISEDGRRELLRIVGHGQQEKVRVIHMGVRIPSVQGLPNRRSGSDFVIACPANLVPVKGHRFLIEACDILVKRGLDHFRCLIIGDGPLEGELRQQVSALGLERVIQFLGRLPHERLIQMYEKGEVGAVVLPSIVTDKGEKEGIPVALMEAMAYGIPVVSTNTGGIPELLSGGAGVVVREKDAQQLADAIYKLWSDRAFAVEIGEKGRRRVEDEFNLLENVKKLLALIGREA